MSGKSGSIGSIVLGVVVGVVAVATGQYYLLGSAAALIIGGGIGLAFQPKVADQQGMQAQELRVSTASVGAPVPVVFGEQRVTPNFLRYEVSTFRNVEVKGEQPKGGKGGGGKKQPPPTIGYEYYLTWEYGLCMGQVDEVGQVYSMPGEAELVEVTDVDPDPWVAFGSEDTLELALENEEEGGVCRFYRGSKEQDRDTSGDPYADDGLNYRNLCWVEFGIGVGVGYKMGSQPAPKTHQFMVRRQCVCLLDNGSSAGIYTRGSLDPNHPAYNSCNAAAIVYEMLTDKVWGRGLSDEVVNVASFVQAADYFAARNMGMSFTLVTADLLSEMVEGVLRQVRSLLVWDGQQYKFKCLLDISATHGTINTVRASEYASLRIDRPLWNSTTNEMRGEFQARERNYRADVVHHQELANIEILGGRVVPERVQLSAFSEREVARRQLIRMVMEQSYPFARLQWEMNRFRSQVEVGDVVRVIDDEVAGATTTIYALVLEVTDSESGDDGIQVTALEDQLISPVEGEETEVTAPTSYQWERVADVDDDVYLGAVPELVREPAEPITALELNSILTGGVQERTLVLGERTGGGMLGLQTLWSLNDSTFFSLGSHSGGAITGELTEAMPGGVYLDRTVGGYQFVVTNDALWGAVLQAVNTLADPEDDAESLVFQDEHYLVVGEEVMQVGLIQQVSGSTYRLRNLIRGRFGTRVRVHPAGTKVFYTQSPQAGQQTGDIPRLQDVWFKGLPIGTAGVINEGDSFQPYHFYPDQDGKYLGAGRCPMPPEPYDVVDGTPVTIRVRPRFFNKGAGVDGWVTSAQVPVHELGDMGFAVLQLDDGNDPLQEAPADTPFTWTPDDLADPEAGMVEIEVTKLAGAVRFRVYATLDGRTSVDYAELHV